MEMPKFNEDRKVSNEQERYQERVGFLFNRCERLIEQAEAIFPEKDFSSRSKEKRDAEKLRMYGTTKSPMPHYVFLYENGRDCWIDGSRMADVELYHTEFREARNRSVRTSEMQEVSFSMELSFLDRFKLGINLSRIRLVLKKDENGLVTAQIRDRSSRVMGQILKGEKVASIDLEKMPKVNEILDRCSSLLAESPVSVTDYGKRDIRNFSTP